MKDAPEQRSLQKAVRGARVRGLLGEQDEPPRSRRERPPPSAASPAGIARTVAGVLAIPLLVFLELGIETARTLGSVFSLGDRER